ncbi:MAG TPA: type II CAAX endopeptidase family protein [Gemmatimonadaceae bacterium]|nr:type II CAAX endopeptidase family protein [Gemmatimonadaceae bacterium]
MSAIGTFLILTFAVTWALWAVVLRVASAAPAPSHIPPLLALGGPVFLVGVFAPGLVAVALTALDEGRPAVVALLRRIVRWRVGLQFYAFALLLMPLTKLAVAVLYRGLTGSWPHFGETHPLVLVVATVLSTLGQAGEEVGWRGYLLPRLTQRAGLGLASLIVGGIWALWHLPLFIMPGADTNGQSFPLYALQITAYSVALAWLYWRTGGSLLLTMFMHAALNNMKDLVPSGGVHGLGPFTLEATLVFRLTVLVLWIVAAVLLVRMRGEHARIAQPSIL